VLQKILNLSPLQLEIAKTHTFSIDRLNRLDGYFNDLFEQKKVTGAVCLVQQNGLEVYNKAFGKRTFGSDLGMPTDGIFYIQSMTKPIISVAFMTLFEEGLFQLNDPVSKYLPQFADRKVANKHDGDDFEIVDADKAITIKQLLNHTAGFSHGLGASDIEKEYREKLYFSKHPNIESRVNSMVDLPLKAQPGTQWNYSASPDVLALLIEKLSGMTAAEFLQKRIFDPIGMSDTGYNLADTKLSRKAMLYQMTEDGTLEKHENQTPSSGHTIYGGTHGLFSTASDYMKFCQMLLDNGKANGHQILGRKTIELMTADHLGEIPYTPGNGWGLGFGVITDGPATGSAISTGTYFWGGAFNTYFFIDPKENMAAILMMQFNPYTDFYANKFRQFVYQAMVE